MGVGYQDVFLVTFLTHPGVIIPEGGGVVGGLKMPSLSGNWAAVWQVFCYWLLTMPFNGRPGTAWTMFVLYILFILFYAYFFLRTRIG